MKRFQSLYTEILAIVYFQTVFSLVTVQYYTFRDPRRCVIATASGMPAYADRIEKHYLFLHFIY